MSALGGVRQLRRHPLRTALAVAGIAVASAMLLDMVMLSGGIDRSFAELIAQRGWQIRLSPKGTLPFDTEATLGGADTLLVRARATAGVAAVGPVLGAAVFAAGRGDSLESLFAYGLDPSAQGLYSVAAGRDLAPGDTAGVMLSEPAARLLGAATGDTIAVVGRLDPQLGTAARERRLVVRGIARFGYDHRDQPSVAAALPVVQALAAVPRDRVSLVLVRAADGADPEAVADRLRVALPSADVLSIAELVRQFHDRMGYFRQLSAVLASMSLTVAVLLVGTLLTITVNERLGEIATLRAIGVQRSSIVRQIVLEGAALTGAGALAGTALGLATARRLDAILTSFPGLPAAFSFFVPRADALLTAAAVLFATGLLAALYPAWLAARAPIAETLRSEAT